MSRTRHRLAVGALTLALSLTAPSRSAAATEADPKVKVTELPQGKMLVIEDHNVPVVTLVVSIPGGRAEEAWWEDQLDLFWPALLRVDPLEASSALRLQPWVGEDRVGFNAHWLRSQEEAATSDLNFILKRDLSELSWRLRRSLGADWRRDGRDPWVALDRRLGALFFEAGDPRRHAVEAPRSGNADGVEVEEARSLLLQRSGWVIGFAGDIDAPRATAVATGLFGLDLEAGQSDPPRDDRKPLRPVASSPPLTELKAPGSEESLVCWARVGLSLQDERAPQAVFLDHLLRERLTDELRGARGHTYFVETGGAVAEVPQIYRIVSPTSPERLEVHSRGVGAVLDSIHREGLRPDELEATHAWLHSYDQVEARSPLDLLRHQLRLQEPLRRALVDGLFSLQDEDVQRFARDWADPSAWLRVHVLGGR